MVNKKKKIWVHTLVYNEENFIWFAVMSVIDFVDKVLIWDSGSTDKTVEVIKEMIKQKGKKIEFRQVGRVDKDTLPKMRAAMVKKSKCDWILLVDGDEIWPKLQINKLLKFIDNIPGNIVGVFNRTKNCIGDIYHFLPESAGYYQIKDIKGHLNIRLIKKTADLTVIGQFPLESYINSKGPIEKQSVNLEFCDCWYLHTSFLKRSSQQKKSGSLGKSKFWEKGIQIQKSQLPEILFIEKPKIVSDPLEARGIIYEVLSLFTTIPIELKRIFR